MDCLFWQRHRLAVYVQIHPYKGKLASKSTTLSSSSSHTFNLGILWWVKPSKSPPPPPPWDDAARQERWIGQTLLDLTSIILFGKWAVSVRRPHQRWKRSYQTLHSSLSNSKTLSDGTISITIHLNPFDPLFSPHKTSSTPHFSWICGIAIRPSRSNQNVNR